MRVKVEGGGDFSGAKCSVRYFDAERYFSYEKIYKNEDCNECRVFNFSRQWRQEYKRSLEV